MGVRKRLSKDRRKGEVSIAMERTLPKVELPFRLEVLYKSLKKSYDDINKHYQDEKLDDKTYLFYGLCHDIMSHGLGVTMNLLFGNEDSPGIDLNCRSLIEAFTILKMMGHEEITEKQAKIYRYQYALVETNDFIVDPSEEDENNEIFDRMIADRKLAITAICEHFGVDEKTLLKSKLHHSDPFFYLKKTMDDDRSFYDLVREYKIFGEKTANIYNFFSFFIHPRFEKEKAMESSIRKLRSFYITLILKYLCDCLTECKLLVFDLSVTSFDDDFLSNGVMADRVKSILLLQTVFDELIQKTCYFKEGNDAYTETYLTQTKGLLVDALIEQSLGFDEQIIGKYKPYTEIFAFYAIINSISDMDEFKARKLAFWHSSRYQILDFIKRVGVSIKPSTEPDVTTAYELFYEKNYKVAFDTFKKKLCGNSRYFLSKNENTYNALFRAAVETAVENVDKDTVERLYKYSEDISHASGYSFNSTPNVITIYSHYAMYMEFKYLWRFTLLATSVLAGVGHHVDLTAETSVFALFASEELKWMQENLS